MIARKFTVYICLHDMFSYSIINLNGTWQFKLVFILFFGSGKNHCYKNYMLVAPQISIKALRNNWRDFLGGRRKH